MRKLFTVDFAVWELYIGTACAVAIFSDYILTRDFFVRQFKGLEGYILICRGSFGLYNGKRSVKKKKNPSRGFFALRRVVITVYYPRYHSNCVEPPPLQPPTSPMLLRSLTRGFYLKIFLPSDSEATNLKLTYRLSPAADSLKSYRFKSSSSLSLNILFVRILT